MRLSFKKIVTISLCLNIFLTLIKLLFGFLAKSSSLVSDGYNSLSDVLISIMIMVALTVSNKKADKNHPYGHEKFEGIAYFLLGIIIFVSALFIIYQAVDVWLIQETILTKPKTYAIYVASIAIILKLGLFVLNKRASLYYNLPSLKADAYNHLVDIFATSISLAGIILAQINLYYFEYIASILIGLFILKTSFDMIKESVTFLVDQAPDEKTVKKIKKHILSLKGVITVDDLKVRQHMTKLYVDVEIGVEKSLSLIEAHDISEHVHDEIENAFDVIHCMVHVNPVKPKKA